MGSTGSKIGQEESEGASEDNKSQPGALRGFLKNKSPKSSTTPSKHGTVKEDQSDSARRMSQQSMSNSSNTSEKDSSEHPEALSPESSKPDGITKLAKVK